MPTSEKNILVIDDEAKLRGLLCRILALEGYQVFDASSAKAGLKILETEDIQVVLSDVKLPDINGIELTEIIKTNYPHIEIINLTAYGTIADGVKAIQKGAFDYITKGDDNDKIIPLVSKAMEKALLQKRVKELENKIAQGFGFDTILGRSSGILEAINLAQKVCPTDTTVLLLGETGTGKEIFAQAIHYQSKRKHKNFVAVNCSALSKDILESELFGHKAGAFTGALKDKKGLFEEADQGTIFLDEIGEMDTELQAKLLRVLEAGTFIKVGSTQTIKVNVRVIAATNRNLQQQTNDGKFRLDLFYRLSVFAITLPSLNQRLDDMEILAKHFLAIFGNKVNKHNLVLTPQFIAQLKQHQWKGNVRELKNVLERAVILADTHQIEPHLLPWEFKNPNPLDTTNCHDLQTLEKHHIAKIMQYTKGNKTEAAKLLNIGLTTLYRKLEEYGI
ncbi:MAG: sigma-54-dependent Fis family transcriptional regulator [Sphingobacteriales bacterium]|nr:MAG: sigma-54-dependent Fis family transcriptional regulator [Sphingobacteriales bacterium]